MVSTNRAMFSCAGMGSGAWGVRKITPGGGGVKSPYLLRAGEREVVKKARIRLVDVARDAWHRLGERRENPRGHQAAAQAAARESGHVAARGRDRQLMPLWVRNTMRITVEGRRGVRRGVLRGMRRGVLRHVEVQNSVCDKFRRSRRCQWGHVGTPTCHRVLIGRPNRGVFCKCPLPLSPTPPRPTRPPFFPQLYASCPPRPRPRLRAARAA